MSARRAERLLRWYPNSWRARYGEEFTELLIADMGEVPRSWRRTLDVAQNGVAARLELGVEASLAALGCAVAAFLVVGVAIWSQLTIGWQWSRPDATVTSCAVVLMSCLLLVFATLAVLAALPIVWAVLRQPQGLAVPLLLSTVGACVVIVGAIHFAHGWPGTGGRHWAHQQLVPRGVAAFAWASTVSISSYWAHPTALLAFPASEVAWMAVSPAALVCLLIGAALTVRRLELPARALRFELRMARLALGAMVAFVVAPFAWIVAGGAGPRNLFHAGAVDLVGVCAMIAALAVARRATAGLAAAAV